MTAQRNLEPDTGLSLEQALAILGRTPADALALEAMEIDVRRRLAEVNGVTISEKKLKAAAHNAVARAYIRRAHHRRGMI